MASSNAYLTRHTIRVKNAEKRAQEAERLKVEGNDLFKAREYVGAANSYVHAIELFGPKPVLLSNLAAAYLKLDLNEEALWAATTALEYDPRMIKARYRRAMARKGLFLFKSAIKDLETIVAEDPSCEIAAQELALIQKIMEDDEGVEEKEEERDHPRYHDEPWDSYSDSETEDCQHKGNNTPCRFYNHDGCIRGRTCQFSHAPDGLSVRDELGKNVCLLSLFNNCEFGAAKCIYSHDKKHLPATGWWNNPVKVEAAKKIHRSGALEDPEYEFLHEELLKNPKGRGFAARPQQIAIIEHMSFQHQNAMEDLRAVSPTIPLPKGRFVLVFSFEWADMFKSIHTHLLNGLKQKLEVVHVSGDPKAHQQSLQFLDMPNLAGVLVADPAIVKRKFTKLLRKLVQYVKNGGSAVLGGSFSSHITPPNFDEFMKNTWGLDWKFGEYHRTTFTVNTANELAKRNPSLVPSYSMKAVHIANIQPEMAIYNPAKGARLQSLVFAPVPIENTSESPAVCTRVGRGLLSFLGDVNAEVGSTNTILAMLGLLDKPNEPLPPPATMATLPTSSKENLPSEGASSKKGKGKQKAKTAILQSNPTPAVQDGSDGPTASTSTSEAPPQKFILVICLEYADMFRGIHEGQLSALKEKADFKFAENALSAIIYLALPGICGVFIADGSLIKASNSHVMKKVVAYVQSGGLALIGGLFSSMTNQPDIGRTFASFGLPWKSGSYNRSEAQLNRHHQTAVKNPTLCDAFSMKAVYLTGFHPDSEDILYERYPAAGDKWESPILRTRIGNGYLGYIGDVNAELESTPVVLAMFNLLTPSQVLVPDSQKFLIILTPHTEKDLFAASFLDDVKKKVELFLSLSNARVIDLLPSKDLVGVLVADSHVLAPKNAYLLSKLVEYSKKGGTLIFGLQFSSQVTTTQFRPLFRDNWGLDWEMASTERSNVTRNSKNSLVARDDSKLPKTFYLDGIYLRGITQSMAVYSPQNRSTLWKPKDGIIMSGVVYAPVEKGHIGFFGVGDMDSEFRTIFYAMVGLL